MNRLRTWLLLSALLLACACDRLAGTEVGNPELTVAARFSMQDTDSTASIPDMNLKVMGMGWNVASDSGACWNNPDGHMVDFADDSKTPLPAVSVKNGEWSKAEMILQADGGAATLPDSAGFSDWSNPRYIKMVKIMGGDTVRALFQLPPNQRIRLGFAKATIEGWRQDQKMIVQIRFDAGKWTAGLTNASFTYRLDGKKERYILLAPDENAGSYEALKALLPQSFMADTADML